MKREFAMESAFNGGDAFSSPLMAVDGEAYTNETMHDRLSFQNLLNLYLNHEEQRPPLQLLPHQAMSAGSSFNYLPYDVSAPMPLPENVAFGSLNAYPASLIRSLDGELNLKMLRQELSTQLAGGSFGYNSGTEPSSFLAEVSGAFGFRHLPALRSLEKQPVSTNTEFGYRTPQNIGGSSLHYIPEKSTGNYQPPTYRRHPHKQATSAPKTVSRSCMLARERRRKQSEKMRYLRKLMPWEAKMETAKMLEEAYKYVKFLQAQVKVLENMPVRGALPSPNPSPALHLPLEMLSRQQLLEAVVNSPAAQTFLYSRGCCIYSVEQLAQLRNVLDRKAVFEQMIIASASMLRS